MPEMSDEELRALPSAVDLATAARAFGISRTKAYELVRTGNFPCPVLSLGSRFRVTRHHLFEALGIAPDNAASGPRGAQPGKPPSTALSPAVMAIPDGGVPVVLIIQAVMLPGTGEQIAGMTGTAPGAAS